MYADGTGLTQLTHSIASRRSAFGPSWSPDGSRIAFFGTGVEDVNGDLYVMDVDGDSIHRLTMGMSPGPPAWSPSGDLIAFCFSEEADDWGSIYTLSVDEAGLIRNSADLTRLTWGHDASGDPAWSPDGTRIAFTQWVSIDPGDTPIEMHYAIWVMNADGSNVVQLTQLGPWVESPAWSPDGAQIAFTCKQPDNNYEVCIMDADGSNRRQLTFPLEPKPYRRMNHPTWSPDGQFIAFECTEDVDTKYICVMKADGSGVVRLTEGSQPAWQPVP